MLEVCVFIEDKVIHIESLSIVKVYDVHFPLDHIDLVKEAVTSELDPFKWGIKGWYCLTCCYTKSDFCDGYEVVQIRKMKNKELIYHKSKV